MGYRNLNSGSIRQQRRQQSRLSTQAPVGGSSVGHGSGLRFYDGGELIIDGLNTGMRFWIQESGGGNSVARLMFTFQDMTDLASPPAIWSQASSRALVLAGPLLTDSTAGPGYGGSNLFLNGHSAVLAAGSNGASPARLDLRDDGNLSLSNSTSSFSLSGSTLSLATGPGGAGFNGYADGAFFIGAAEQFFQGSAGGDLAGVFGGDVNFWSGGDVGLRGAGASFTGNANSSWSVGDSSGAVVQGTSSGGLGLWGQGIQANGDFTVAGSKNFIMDHPAKPGHTIKYAATESPVSGIEDRGRVTIGDDGTAQIVFPEHFTAIVKDGTDVDVFLQAYGPDPAWCDVPTREGTTVHGEPGTVVAWHALAERLGADFTVVEKGSIQTQPEPQPETEGQQWQQQQPSPPK